MKIYLFKNTSSMTMRQATEYLPDTGEHCVGKFTNVDALDDAEARLLSEGYTHGAPTCTSSTYLVHMTPSEAQALKASGKRVQSVEAYDHLGIVAACSGEAGLSDVAPMQKINNFLLVRLADLV